MDQYSSYSKHTVVGVIAISLFLILVHFFFFHGGYFGYDEMEYCRLAHMLSNGHIEHNGNLYAFRYLGYFPLAISYLIFGVTDFANMIVSMIFLIAIIQIAMTFLYEIPLWIKSVVTIGLICMPMHLMYLEKPMPDIITEFGFLLCFYSYYQSAFIKIKSTKNWNEIGFFLIGFIFIFLSKETFLVFYPYFFLVWIWDLKRKRNLHYWKYVIIGIGSITLLYLLINQVILGDAFARVRAIFNNRFIGKCTYEVLPIKVLIERVLTSLWYEFIRNGYLLPACFLILLRKNYQLPAATKFIFCSWISLLFLANFMTISYTDYVPLCNDARHFMYILPLGAIILGIGLLYISQLSITDKIIAALILVAQLALSVWKGFENQWFLFAPMILAVLLGHLMNRSWKIGFLVSIGLLSIYYQNAKYNLGIKYHKQQELIEFVKRQEGSNKLVITDPVNTGIGNYSTGFDSTQVKFVQYIDYNSFYQNSNRTKYIIINGMSMYLSELNWDELPEYAKTAHEKLPKVFTNESGEIYLFNKQ